MKTKIKMNTQPASSFRFASIRSALIAAGLFAQSAFGFTPFVVRDIRIEGVQRTEPGTIFSYLPVKVGDQMTDAKAAEAIKALFATGFFRDVRLEIDKDVLVLYLEERPAIASVDITGSKDIEKDILRKAVRDLGLAEARIFDRAMLEKAEQEIKRQYLARGRYAVKVVSTVTPLERNRVGLSFAIEEGDVAKIASIRFVGNKAFTDKQLLEQIRSGTPTWASWYSKADQYSKEKVAGDLEALRSFYQDRGFLEFSVDSTQVSISSDKESVDIVVGLNEGQAYKLAGVRFGGELQGRADEFNGLSTMKVGETFSASQLNATSKAVSDRLGALGYAFANVNPVPEINREKREVTFNFLIDPGRRVYVRRINVSGNDKTRDEVIRRELRQFEDSWYDGERIRLSKDRISRLGFFKDVQIESVPVPDAPDQVDLSVAVAERTTGNFTVGVGFGSTEKVILTAAINQSNFLGTGNSLSAEINTSRLYRTISVSSTNPYFTADGISRTFEGYTRLTNAKVLNFGDYTLRSTGLGLRFGIPYAELDRWFVGLGLENTAITAGTLAPQRITDFVNTFGGSSTGVVATLGWRRDARDSSFTPTRGSATTANTEITLPVGDFRYIRSSFNHQTYIPLSKNYTLALNADLAIGSSFSGKVYPFFKNYYAGGIGTVRGFEPSSLGPSQFNPLTNLNNPIGGQSRLLLSAEYIFPLPGTGNDGAVRSFFFFDGGNVFAGNNIKLGELRYSTGIGLNWASPVGPMKISFGVPINKQVGDRTQKIQFQIGTGF